jgi:hypothetical protein
MQRRERGMNEASILARIERSMSLLALEALVVLRFLSNSLVF